MYFQKIYSLRGYIFFCARRVSATRLIWKRPNQQKIYRLYKIWNFISDNLQHSSDSAGRFTKCCLNKLFSTDFYPTKYIPFATDIYMVKKNRPINSATDYLWKHTLCSKSTLMGGTLLVTFIYNKCPPTPTPTHTGEGGSQASIVVVNLNIVIGSLW